MANHTARFARLASAAAVALLIVGCSNSPKKGDQAANEIDVDSPDILNTDKPRYDNPGWLMRTITGNSKENERKLKEAEQRLARLERQLQEQHLTQEPAPATAVKPAQVSVNGPVPKIGLVLGQQAPRALADGLEQAVVRRAGAYPVVLVGPTAMGTHLAGYNCDAQSLAACAERLAVYPGARMIVSLDGFSTAQDRIKAMARVTDAAYGIEYPPFEVAVPAVDGRIAAPAQDALADSLIARALDRARFAPWSTRAFSREGSNWFVAAGSDSGLKVGDTLEIRDGGRLISAPTGAPAGWIPGERKGSLRVTGFFGDDLATAQLVQGQAPEPSDVLLLSR